MKRHLVALLIVLWLPFIAKTWPTVEPPPDFPPCDCQPDWCVCMEEQ